MAIICIYALAKDNIPLQMSFKTNLKEKVEKYSDKPLIIGERLLCLHTNLAYLISLMNFHW